jgi:hypothetical protein
MAANPQQHTVTTRFAMSGHEELVPCDVARCPYCGDRVMCRFSENGYGCIPSYAWRCICGCERKQFDITLNVATLKSVAGWAEAQPVRVYGHCDNDGKHHRVYPADLRVCPKCSGVSRIDCECELGRCECEPWRDGTIWCDWCDAGKSQAKIDASSW